LAATLSVIWLKGLTPLIVSLRRLLSSPLSEYVEKVVEVPVEKIVEKTVEKIGA
jgi:hypothetical protein